MLHISFNYIVLKAVSENMFPYRRVNFNFITVVQYPRPYMIQYPQYPRPYMVQYPLYPRPYIIQYPQYPRLCMIPYPQYPNIPDPT